ncbi:MAG: hypothetical protein R3F24_05505 [Gammaproteobacteria bacterium]
MVDISLARNILHGDHDGMAGRLDDEDDDKGQQANIRGAGKGGF